ncbi:unnamed protein product [Mytilus coruscus]|uniref:Uncharacterized protein n=1 Tax=Mytilus coruscus TaxID=42192 RepID=A0A6J8C7Q2_MYTCO|nr:unnamed protein product [Mytilus coruscus]
MFVENSDKLIVLNILLNYSYQDFKCKWDYIGQGNHPDSLLNITKLSVVREVIDVMDFGQKYWLSDISESVYSLVQQCEVFNHVANSTLSRKSYTAMRYCDDMNTYKCIDGWKYRTAVSLVKYLHHRHLNDHGRKRMNYSGDFVWKVSCLTLSGGIVLFGLLVTCLNGNTKKKILEKQLTQGLYDHLIVSKEKRQVPEKILNDLVYDDDWIQMKQTASLKHDTSVLPSGSALSENIQDARTSRKSNETVIRI